MTLHVLSLEISTFVAQVGTPSPLIQIAFMVIAGALGLATYIAERVYYGRYRTVRKDYIPVEVADQFSDGDSAKRFRLLWTRQPEPELEHARIRALVIGALAFLWIFVGYGFVFK